MDYGGLPKIYRFSHRAGTQEKTGMAIVRRMTVDFSELPVKAMPNFEAALQVLILAIDSKASGAFSRTPCIRAH
jgi:hypothetical protein